MIIITPPSVSSIVYANMLDPKFFGQPPQQSRFVTKTRNPWYHWFVLQTSFRSRSYPDPAPQKKSIRSGNTHGTIRCALPFVRLDPSRPRQSCCIATIHSTIQPQKSFHWDDTGDARSKTNHRLVWRTRNGRKTRLSCIVIS